MLKIIISTYMVRYPMGGNLSWALHWALGFQRLGHEVFLVEKANYEYACFDPINNKVSNHCKSGLAIVLSLLSKYGLEDKYLFQDFFRQDYGVDTVKNIFNGADLMVDIGNHGAWLPEANQWNIPSVLVDGEPGYTQMKMEKALADNQSLPKYDYYFSNGANIGLSSCTAPHADKEWKHVYNPIVVDLFVNEPPSQQTCLTTVMNWQSHADFYFKGKSYGQKDVEFSKFIALPNFVKVPLEIAVAGKNIPEDNLKKNGWNITDAHEITKSIDSYYSYIRRSMAEFSVCKEAYVSTHSGWFSDRSSAYLANSRPVILQDTGFSEHIPCGKGCFAIKTIDDAVNAIDKILSDYKGNCKSANEIARTYFDSNVVLSNFLTSLSIT